MSDDDASFNVHIGDVIAGKYRVERVLGRGAMGVVVAAMHIELGEMRAIKFMSPEALEEQGAAERFLREAKAASRLKSQHVARVYDVGRMATGDGKDAPYIVMEHLEGADLRARLKKGGPLSVDETVLYVVQACEAIGEAHAAGIVHRDLKPGNLFLTTGVGGAPCIKVFDFGIAKLAHAGGVSDGRDLTATAALMGTPKYMSPEQMRADRHGVDARSDIWALGVTLYALLTRHTPFEGDSIASLCSAVMWEEPAPASSLRPDLPAGLDAVIARCLAKEPAKRFQTAAALAEALLPFASDAVQRAAPRILVAPAAPAPAIPAPRASSPDPPAPLSTTTSSDSALAAATGAPWAHATGTPRRSSWSGARMRGVVGLVVGALAAGTVVVVRMGTSPRAPVASAVTNEAVPAIPASSAAAVPPPASNPPEIAPSVTVAPVTMGETPKPPAAPVADAGAVTPPRPLGSARPAGKGARSSTDPFWSSRR